MPYKLTSWVTVLLLYERRLTQIMSESLISTKKRDIRMWLEMESLEANDGKRWKTEWTCRQKKYDAFSSTSADQNLFVFSMNKMCILETLLDVEISKAICNLFPWLRSFMYIFDGREFWFLSIYSFFCLCL